MVVSSVVVHNLYVVSLSAVPAKTDAVLIVDPDAVLSDPVSLQAFELVARPDQKIAQGNRSIQGIQPPLRGGFDVYEPADSFIVKQPFGIAAAERPDHSLSIIHFT